MMSDVERHISRRGFLYGSAAAAAAGAGLAAFGTDLGRLRAASPIVRTLAHEVRHEMGTVGASAGGLQLAGGESLALGAASSGATYESPVIESELPYTHVGIHWLADYPEGSEIDFEARTSVDGESWSDWRKVQIEAAAGEAAGGETYGSLLEENRGRYLQYRARFRRGGGGSPSLRHVTATFLNSVDGPVVERPLVTASGVSTADGVSAAAPAPPIDFTREEWGADESLRFSGGAEVWPRMYVPVKKIIVHHTVSSNSYSSGAAQVRSIYYYHTVTLGWGDIGYNALVDRFGYSYEGRRGRQGSSVDDAGWGREIFSRGVVAGHVFYHNRGSCGIALIGDHTYSSPSSSAIWKVSRLAAHVAQYFGLPPHGNDDFKRSDGSWAYGLANVCGHRDAGDSACPGYYAYAQLPAIRNNIVSLLNHASGPAVKITDGPSQSVLTGKATYSFTGGSEFSYYLEGWQLNQYTGEIAYRSGYKADKTPDWSPWTKNKTAEFHHLGKGWYTFHVRSRSSTGKISVYHDMYKTRTTNGTIHLFSDVGAGYWAHDIIEQMYELGYVSGVSVDPPLYKPASSATRAQMAALVIRAMGEKPKAAATGTVYSDVPKGHWAARYIERLAQLGIEPAVSGNRFRPDETSSRAGTVLFLAKALGEKPLPSPSGTVFSDVAASYAHAGYIEALARLGIAQGDSQKRFRPGDPTTRAEAPGFLMRAWSIPTVSRAQMATYLVRAMGEGGNLPAYQGYFSDVTKGKWYTPWIERLRQLNLTSGFGDGTYRPDRDATRAEIAAMIVLGLGHSPVAPTGTVFSDVKAGFWAAGYIEKLAQLGLVSGYKDGTFKPDKALVYPEIVAFVSRAWEIAWPPPPP
jgi:hypothetical protein